MGFDRLVGGCGGPPREGAWVRSRAGMVTPGRTTLGTCPLVFTSVRLSCESHEVFGDRPETQRREKRERADDDDHADEERGEESAVRGKGPWSRRHGALLEH